MRRNRPAKTWTAAVGLALALSTALGSAGGAIAQDQGGTEATRVVSTPPTRIGSRWIASTFLNIEGGKLQNTVIQLGWVSSMWTVDTIEGDRVHIRSVWQQDQYLNIASGELNSSVVPPDAASAQWIMEPIGKGFYVRFRSVANPDLYINVAEGKLQASAIQQDSLSADWWLLR